MDFSPLDV